MARINITGLVILSRRKTNFYAIFHSGYGLHFNTKSKRFNEEIILRNTVQEEDAHILHGYGLQYNMRSKRVNE